MANKPRIKTDNMVFVFGSNLAGIHGAGAARYAREYRGAQMGIGIGRTGQSYAIPTKGLVRHAQTGEVGIGSTLHLHIIQDYVNDFLNYAWSKLNVGGFPEFQVTCIGCGLAGLRHSDIAPMFIDAPANCLFDDLWLQYLDVPNQGTPPIERRYWGTFG